LALAKFPDKTQEQVANHVGCDRAYVSKVASELVNSHKLKLPTTRKGKDGKERRLEHDTFEDYCQEKWGWKRQRAYEMIAAADAVKILQTTHKPARSPKPAHRPQLWTFLAVAPKIGNPAPRGNGVVMWNRSFRPVVR
jgi:hypothetical protein